MNNNKTEFHAVIALSKTKIFEVDYYTLDGNKAPYFATSAAQFTRNKRNYNCCGQCQEDILLGYNDLYYFYIKYDKYHCKDLTNEIYNEMMDDLNILFKRYPYLIKYEINKKNYFDISFYEIKEFTMKYKKKRTVLND